MKIEDCEEGVKVRWEAGGRVEEGVIWKENDSIFIGDEWVLVNFSGEIMSCHADSLTVIEQPLQDTQVNTERKYSKEEIIEYLTYEGYTGAVSLIMAGLDDYFSPINEEERNAINLLKSKGYTVQK